VSASTTCRWRRRRYRGVFTKFGATAVGAPAAAYSADEKQAAEARGEPNDEGKMLVDPGFDFFADGSVFALAVLTCPSTGTIRTVQKILLQTKTILDSQLIPSEFRACTAEHAITIVTGICIVALCITAHDGLALLIS